MIEIKNLSGEVIYRAEVVANLRGAYLGGADLSGANLGGANLSGANLRRANLSGANLGGADLSGAVLSGSSLRTACLYRATLDDVEINAQTILPSYQIPQEGELIVWKKLVGGVICKLLIPAKARRTASVVGRKCRAEYAKVLEGSGYGIHDATRYTKGRIVRPDSYDPNPLVECTHGIHFFLTREEAEEYKV